MDNLIFRCFTDNKLLFFSLLCYIVCISSKSRAIILIGPYKTGSSTVQLHLLNIAAKLRRKHIYLPETKCDNKKYGSSIIRCIKMPSYQVNHHRNDSKATHCTITCDEFHTYVSKHRDQNHTIIFGHEIFSNHMNKPTLTAMLKVLEGYEVWFVSFYRPVTTRMFSYHGQSHFKDVDLNFVYFDKWYETFKPTHKSFFDANFVDNIVDTLVNLNDSNNNRLYLVDFNNAIKKRMEPHQVIHCDILQLCGPKHADKPAPLKSNGHKDRFGKYDQLFYNFRLFVERKKCKLLHSSAYYTQEEVYWRAFQGAIPYIQTTNEQVKIDALQSHQSLYGLQALHPDNVKWLYANERLSLDSINGFTYQEVNRDSFINNEKFKNAFDDMLHTGTRRKDIECVTS